MPVALYFGKVNLVYEPINEILRGEKDINDVLRKVHSSLIDGIDYKEDIKKKVEDQIYYETVEYRLGIKEKTENYLQGYIYKKSLIHYKTYDEGQKELVSDSIQNTEGVEFYYDVFHERIGYQRSLRLGYKEFLKAFEGILNKACELAGLGYCFTVNQITQGLRLDEIKEDIRGESIQKMKIRYQLPNPDIDNLEEIKKNPGQTIREFENANLAIKTVTLVASTTNGLKIDSKLVEEELNQVDNLHTSINSETAMQNGYVEIETTNKDGVVKSTADKKPIVVVIDDVSQMKDMSIKMITSLLVKKTLNNY